jgi:7-keto-8-aminopelargonate synthetase-like enzyme
MIFSGPVQPPMLGAALASVRIHLSDELVDLQAAMRERIVYCRKLLEGHSIPTATEARTPILYVPVRPPGQAREIGRRMLEDGIYINVATYPAVPRNGAGTRFMLTLHHRPSDIRTLVQTVARHMPHATTLAAAT